MDDDDSAVTPDSPKHFCAMSSAKIFTFCKSTGQAPDVLNCPVRYFSLAIFAPDFLKSFYPWLNMQRMIYITLVSVTPYCIPDEPMFLNYAHFMLISFYLRSNCIQFLTFEIFYIFTLNYCC